MRSLLYAVAALPLLTGIAWATESVAKKPVQLTAPQMDKVHGGHFEIDVSNTSTVEISLFGRAFLTEPTGNSVSCSDCFLLINSPTFAIGAKFGP